ncbi:MAG: hypothetical protein WCI49_01005 [Ferruginibacter sp.]
MSNTTTIYRSGDQLPARSVLIWRIVQALVWLVGFTIFICLIFFPAVGLLLFWNILIPVAPALLVVATGLWRNICPLATTTLFPRHLNLSKKQKMPVVIQTRLQLLATILLFVIVPLRHAVFNTNGMATAILLASSIIIGVTMGFFYDWKSAWCSTLCPIHPVEKLYGGKTVFSFPNAHCNQCVNCSIPCPDSTPGFHPVIVTKTINQKISGILIIGVLPGFIWGWFHVPDNHFNISWQTVANVYTMPVICGIISLAVYIILSQLIKGKGETLLINCFAAAAVSCYYWFRIPELFGFGEYEGDGLLINLKDVLPEWTVAVMTAVTTIFFFLWLTVRRPDKKSWILRPRFAE